MATNPNFNHTSEPKVRLVARVAKCIPSCQRFYWNFFGWQSRHLFKGSLSCIHLQDRVTAKGRSHEWLKLLENRPSDAKLGMIKRYNVPRESILVSVSMFWKQTHCSSLLYVGLQSKTLGCSPFYEPLSIECQAKFRPCKWNMSPDFFAFPQTILGPETISSQFNSTRNHCQVLWFPCV